MTAIWGELSGAQKADIRASSAGGQIRDSLDTAAGIGENLTNGTLMQ